MVEISIVIPVYNAARFLRETLLSLQAQTFSDWECICVNDGSTDESPTIIREVMATDSRIQLFEQANAGLSSARNRGVERSKAPYIFFMDSDDLLYPKALESLYRTIRDTSAEVVWGRMQQFVNELLQLPASGEVQVFEGESLRKWVSKRFSQPYEMDPFWGIPVEAWGKLIKREVMKRHPQPEDLRIAEDNVFSAGLFRDVTRVGVVDAWVYGYRQVANSLFHQRTETWILGYTDSYCRVLTMYQEDSTFLSNYINGVIRGWFIRGVFTDCLLMKRIELYPAIQTMCNAFRSHPAFRFAKSRLKWWLWLGTHRGLWFLLRWSYKRSTLYKKSLNK